MEQWLVTNKRADFKEIGKRYGIDQVTARIIRNRDVITDEEISLYLSGRVKDLHNPHLLKDGEKMVDILQDKIKMKKIIRVIGDYDIDGVMSSYILKTALERVGANVSVMIPDRMKDGYGLNRNLIENAKEDGIDTILTCDNGIAAIDEINLAKEYGMTVLVTDHHEIPFDEIDGEKIYKTSKADAIVNPHQKDCLYPYNDLCGAGVAWKVVCLLYEAYQIPMEEAYDLLQYAGFATIGDIMPLLGENRIIVKEGLKRIRCTNSVGLRALIAQSGLDASNIDAYHIGFILGPCVNASGRLDTAQRALQLLFEKDEKKANQIANELVVLNDKRKEMTLEGVKEAIKAYEENGYENHKVLVIYLPNVHESIAGIIAGRIREMYYKPTFILTKGEEGVKGSGRSIEEYSMYEEMSKCKELFRKFGGHPMAAGLSMEEENIAVFRDVINKNCGLTQEEMEPKIHIDVPMPMDYVSMDLIREFEILAPFGKDNTKPVFADKNLRISRMWIIGKNQNVLRLSLKTENGSPLSAIYFGDIEKMLSYMKNKFGESEVEAAFVGRENQIRMAFVYYPKINVFREMENIQFEIQNYQ